MTVPLAKDPSATRVQLVFAIVGYMACSSLMLIANKLAVHFFPAPSFVLWAQVSLEDPLIS
jgi:hypothetical protein